MVKRGLDVLAAAVGLLLLAPLFALVAMAIKWESPGPVFFRQERVGRHGKTFRIFKFRTMAMAPSAGLQLTVDGDARITRVGAILRRYKIDELAQLIDVLRGTMSLVGPRPEVPRYVEAYSDMQRERVLSVRPGITDFASLLYRDENSLLAKAQDPEREYLEVILPEKLRVAINYVDHASLAGDLKVLGLTVRTVFAPRGAVQAMRRVMQHQKFWSLVDQGLNWAHGHRLRVATAVDGVVVLLAWHLTYLFRLGFERWQPGRPWYDDRVSVAVVLTYLVCLQVLGVRRSMWRYFAFDDFRRLGAACLVAGLLSAVGVLLAHLVAVPRAVLVLHPLFTLFGLVMVRTSYRMLKEHAQALAQGHSDTVRYVVVLGAGEVARRLIAGLHQRQGWFVMMILDDDPSTHGSRISGVRVEGSLDRLRDPALSFGATHAIVALDGSGEHQSAAIDLATQCGLVVMTVPGPDDLSPIQS